MNFKLQDCSRADIVKQRDKCFFVSTCNCKFITISTLASLIQIVLIISKVFVTIMLLPFLAVREAHCVTIA